MTLTTLDVSDLEPSQGWKRQRSNKELRHFINQHLAKLDFEKLNLDDVEA